MKIIFLLSIFLLSLSTASVASFDAYYAGSPDLTLNVIEQRSKSTFRFIVCNQGDTSTATGNIRATIRGSDGNFEERYFRNTSIPSGKCTAYDLESVSGYVVSSKRKVSVQGMIEWIGDRAESKTNNNTLRLGAKKARVDISEISEKTVSTKVDPVYDLWDSGTDTTTVKDGHTYYPSGGSSSSGNGATNGDFSPANPTWAIRQGQQNIVYVIRDGTYYPWYNSNGVMFSRPGENWNTPYYDSNNYNYGSINPVTTNGQGNVRRVENRTLGSSSFCNAYNPQTRSYEWVCASYYADGDTSSNNSTSWSNNSNTPPTQSGWYNDKSDLSLKNLRQNGNRSEFIANVCNGGEKMYSSQSSTLRISNGNYSTTATFYAQLERGGCTEVYVNFSNLNIVTNGNNNQFFAELDIYANIAESNEDNNKSFWWIRVN